MNANSKTKSQEPDWTASAERLIQMYPNESFTFPHFGNSPHRVSLLAELMRLKSTEK